MRHLRAAGVVACAALALAARAGAADWDKAAARKHNDARTKAWLQWPKAKARAGGGASCVCCHTIGPFALARPALGPVTAEETAVIDNAKARVAVWDKVLTWDGTAGQPRPFYPQQLKASHATEAVLNALILVNDDVCRNQGKLRPTTKAALSALWKTQDADGGFPWLDFDLRPWEKDGHYYGTALAAVAVGMAGKGYYEDGLTATEKAQLGKLRDHLKDKYKGESLHNRLAGLWAASKLPGVLTAERQKEVVKEALAVGKAEDDGWAITSLGKKPDDDAKWGRAHAIPADATFDGYGTAFTAFVLKQAGVPTDSGRLAKARAWLAKHKVAEGAGPVVYLNKARDPDAADADAATVGKFMRDAAAAYASLALLD